MVVVFDPFLVVIVSVILEANGVSHPIDPIHPVVSFHLRTIGGIVVFSSGSISSILDRPTNRGIVAISCVASDPGVDVLVVSARILENAVITTVEL